MHIPDGYLSPATCAASLAVAAPVMVHATRRAREELDRGAAPRLALLAAFAFVVMMLNVPLPGGTSAHATGAVVMAVAVGPWAAVLGMALVLLVQAVLFGDGGILAYGANVLVMAVALPLVGWRVYRWVAGRRPSPRRWTVAAAAGGWAGTVAAAVVAAVLLGIQPLVAHGADGAPLYCPYGLGVTVPAVVGSHLLVGVAEGALTAGVLAAIRRGVPELLGEAGR